CARQVAGATVAAMATFDFW
nr:immunoglobulin heavy chain junction region [Macaca mulatta]MOW79687.1 immunoglobulin heavy chain junction region [Macaca mulatta]MOW84842.1 immunoglobulin heavy chain junction region [Macaca mulatta]MOW85824.1 immunoglobulin heavy chain junction region [Macaca mulatta]